MRRAGSGLLSAVSGGNGLVGIDAANAGLRERQPERAQVVGPTISTRQRGGGESHAASLRGNSSSTKPGRALGWTSRGFGS